MFSIDSIKFISVKELTIKAKMNTHGYGRVSGIVSYKDEEKLKLLMHSERIKQIYYKIENKSKEVIFSGYIESVIMHKNGKFLETTIILVGATKKLDVIKKTKAFQDLSISYKYLINLINNQYNDTSVIFNKNVEKTIDDLIVQYNETDWEFLKRIASNFNAGLFPDIFTKQTAYYFGIPKFKNKVKREISECDIDSICSEYCEGKENELTTLTEKTFWMYKILTREKIQLGEQIVFHGMILWVKSLCANWEKGELIYTGELVPKKGLECAKTYNEKIIGASLEAYVEKILADKVQVKILCDAESNHKKAKNFLYSTVYSSADGTGWYCMPEKNDKVRLYFPNENEGNGYIISSVHEEVEQENQFLSDTRTIPDNKSISTKFGKQIELTPTQIIITNNKGMQILIDDNEGIQIISNKGITIESKEDINLISAMETLSLSAIESIEFIQGNTKLVLKDDIILEGTKFKVQ